MNIFRVQTTWHGFPGAPGFTNLYFQTSGGSVLAVSNFFQAIAGKMCREFSFTIPAEGESFDDATGVLTGTFTDGVGVTINGTGDSEFAGPVGAVVDWRTSSINRGRKVRGRTFLVPIPSSTFEADGTLMAPARTLYQNAATALVTASAGALVVWSRPRAHVGGMAAPVTSAFVPDLAAVLRSRRD